MTFTFPRVTYVMTKGVGVRDFACSQRCVMRPLGLDNPPILDFVWAVINVDPTYCRMGLIHSLFSIGVFIDYSLPCAQSSKKGKNHRAYAAEILIFCEKL